MDSFFMSLEGAFAPNTLRAYKSDWQHYAAWCENNQYEPLQSTEGKFASYVLTMGETLTTATIRRRIASLRTLFKLVKAPNPTDEPKVILTLKRLHRKLGRAQKQAEPLTHDIYEKLIGVCRDDIVGMRNKLLLQLGHETMRRRSELCSFTFEDVHRLPNGHPALLLKRSKTDQYGDGKIIPISQELYDLIEQWKRLINEDKGVILRGFRRNLKPNKKLNPSSINTILKKLQQKAGISDQGALSGHSFRVGTAIDLLEKGMPIEKIMLKGGWKSEATAIRYLRNWQDIYE